MSNFGVRLRNLETPAVGNGDGRIVTAQIDCGGRGLYELSIGDGRRMVQAARKYRRVVQAGSQ